MRNIVVAAGYARMSRQEERQGERQENHEDILIRLGEESGIPLDRSAIEFEVEQSNRLDTREGIQRILHLCRSGAITHLLVMDVSRMTRGDEDQWAAIKKALFAGGITLVTPRGSHLFDDKLDTTILDIEAVLARRYRWEYSLKRKIHNEARAKRGELSSGFAALGYKWDKEARTYIVEDRERYELACSMVTRVLKGMSVYALTRELNTRLSATGSPRPPGRSSVWHHTTVHRIVGNPIYAGMPAKRIKVRRDGQRQKLDRSDWIQPDSELDYEHPITPAEHEILVLRMAGRRAPGFGTYGSSHLLTGILLCPRGQLMCAGSRATYSCKCKIRGIEHPGHYFSEAVGHAVALHVIRTVLAAVPDSVSPIITNGTDRTTILKDFGVAQRLVNQKRQQCEELIRHIALLMRAWSEEEYERQAAIARQELATAEARVEELRSLIEEPDPVEVKTLLSALRDIGFDDFWAAADVEDRRIILQRIIGSIRLVEPKQARQQVRFVEVELRRAWQPYYPERLIRVHEIRPHHASGMREPCSITITDKEAGRFCRLG